LSGALADGTSGLLAIKRAGGTTVVQEPSDAWFDSMPRSAIAHVHIDHQLPAAQIGQLLVALSAALAAPADPRRRYLQPGTDDGRGCQVRQPSGSAKP
jgi:two-component system chemotaxis response regulator CheB